MARLYDVVATIGTYQKDGQTKYVSRNIGSVIETKNGPSLILDACFNLAACNRTEDGKVFLALFTPKVEGQHPQQNAPQSSGPQAQRTAPNQPPAGFDSFDDDLAF